ncbi:MAG: TrbC/VirB2 family protein [Candidatus Pacebacteria bacterium]|jgi:hypothetical protein|nr:TrbC/VirB2 family protein [Candidatus Paceibacterota bacterium]
MKKIIAAIATAATLLAAQTASAQILPACGGQGQPACKICHLFILIDKIIQVVIVGFVPVIAGLVIAIAGIKMLIDRENAEVWEKSKEIILMVVIGLVLIYGAYAIVQAMFIAAGYPGNFNPLDFSTVDC